MFRNWQNKKNISRRISFQLGIQLEWVRKKNLVTGVMSLISVLMNLERRYSTRKGNNQKGKLQPVRTGHTAINYNLPISRSAGEA